MAAREGSVVSDSEEPLQIDQLFSHKDAPSLRRFPEMFKRALRITWTAAPFQLVVVTVLQVLSGLGIAAQVLIARDVLQALVEHQGKGTCTRSSRMSSLLALVTAALQFVTTAITEVSRVLSGLVEQHAIGSGGGGGHLRRPTRLRATRLPQRSATRPSGGHDPPGPDGQRAHRHASGHHRHHRDRRPRSS